MDPNIDFDRSAGQVLDSLGVSASKSDSSCNSIQKYKSVRTSRIIRDLPAEISLERNFIKVPICVSNPKSANVPHFVYEFAERQIDGEKFIPRLVIISGASTPLPLPQHAKVLDILFAMLAHNFNDDGEIYFKYADISRLLGQYLGQNRMIKEAIKRYHFNSIFFQHCWADDPERFTSQIFHPIIKTDLYDGDDKQARNPRNSHQKENLHYVKFAPEIVNSVRKSFIRLFPKEAFSELDAGTYILYKLFYAPTDREPIIRSVKFIANFLGWGNRIDRLRPWIVKHLDILQKKEFILWWRKKEDCFEVCSNAARFKRHIAELRRLNPLKAENTKAIALKESRKKAKLVGEKIDLQTHEAVQKLPPKTKKKPSPPSNSNLLHTEEIFSQLAKMSPSERSSYLASIKEIPLVDKSGFLSSKVEAFLDKQN